MENVKDICSEYEGEERRKHCELVVVLKAQIEADRQERDKWRTDVDRKLGSLITFIQKIEGPYHAGLWAVRIMFGAFLLGVATAIIEYVRKHWN